MFIRLSLICALIGLYVGQISIVGRSPFRVLLLEIVDGTCKLKT